MDLNRFLTDESPFKGDCDNAIKVKETEDVINAMKSGERITCRGAGTGLEGAGVPSGGCVLSFEKWTGMLNHNTEANVHYMTFAAGTTLAQIRQTIRKEDPGYYWKPDPTEENATIGGLFSTDAKGPSCYGYGSTSDHVAGIRIVTTDGEEQSVTEPERLKCLAGTEGSLFAITECTITTVPVPEEQYHLILFFEKEATALAFQDALIAGKEEGFATLVGMDYLDVNALEMLRELVRKNDAMAIGGSIPEDGECAVYLILHGDELIYDDLEIILGMLEEDYGVSEDHAWAASEENEIRKFRTFRHGVQEACNDRIHLLARQFAYRGPWNIDVKTGKKDFAEMIAYIRECFDGNVTYAVCAHYGNGEACITFLPETEAECHWLTEEIPGLVEKLRTAELSVIRGFGIGKLRKDFIKDTDLGRNSALLKEHYDPAGKLNPGNGI